MATGSPLEDGARPGCTMPPAAAAGPDPVAGCGRGTGLRRASNGGGEWNRLDAYDRNFHCRVRDGYLYW